MHAYMNYKVQSKKLGTTFSIFLSKVVPSKMDDFQNLSEKN